MEFTIIIHAENLPYLKSQGIKFIKESKWNNDDRFAEITILVTNVTLVEIFYAGVKAGIDRKF
jgi:hypothetical protein